MENTISSICCRAQAASLFNCRSESNVLVYGVEGIELFPSYLYLVCYQPNAVGAYFLKIPHIQVDYIKIQNYYLV